MAVSRIILRILTRIITPRSTLCLIITRAFRTLGSGPGGRNTLGLFSGDDAGDNANAFRVLPITRSANNGIVVILAYIGTAAAIRSNDFLF